MRITSKGQVTIPQAIREKAGLLPNTEVEFEMKGGRVLLRPAAKPAARAQQAIGITEAPGFETMTLLSAERAGGAYEPELVQRFLSHAERFREGLDGPVDRETILALEPLPHAMLDEAGVPVFFEHRLAEVKKDGARITALTFENGNRIEAKMFVDATYEGDPFGRAGWRYFIGR